MNVTFCFLARFRERFGPVHEPTAPAGVRFLAVLRMIAGRIPRGRLGDSVIVMRDSERIEPVRVPAALGLGDGQTQTFAVFPPRAGG